MKSLAFAACLFLTAACSAAPLSVGHEMEGGTDPVSADGQASDVSDAMGGGSDAVSADGQASDICPLTMPQNNLPCSDVDAGACLYPGQNCGSPGGGPDFNYYCTCIAAGFWTCTGGC
jgi:hypothetical protein